MVKNSPANTGDLSLIPGAGRSPGGGHGNPLQYFCLENLHGQRSLAGHSSLSHKESDTTEVTEYACKHLSWARHWLLGKYYHIAAAAAKSLQSCPTLCDPTDGSPPSSPVPGILQARTLEWVAISFSNA